MSFALSLRASSTAVDGNLPLGTLVARINEEREHFRLVTEEGLRREIEEEAAAAEREEDDSSEDEKPQDIDSRRKALYAARAEMLKFVCQAQNEALTALDFMSLLLSRDAPKQASTMSEFLKQAVPSGTLNFDNTQASKPTKAQDDAAKKVSMGWNFQSLNSAADRLLDSATRLESELRKEARYWDGILSVSEKGWSVCRLPREARTVGVRFGFSEAAPQFSSQGFAALWPDNDGNIILDQGLSVEPTSMHVTLVKEGRVVGTSSIPTLARAGQAPLETLIDQAQNRLFEAELFQEMLREARSLLSYGVEVVADQIRLPGRLQQATSHTSFEGSPYSVQIDQVPLLQTVETVVNHDGDQLANILATAFRILLTRAHRNKFRQRTQPSLPLSSEKQSAPMYNILKPVMSFLQHHDAVQNLHGAATHLSQCMRLAGLEASLTTEAFSPEALLRKSKTSTNVESLVATLSNILRTQIVIELPSAGSYTIITVTQLSPPTYGTSFEVHLPSTLQKAGRPATLEFREVADLQEHLINTTCAAVAWHISTIDDTWKVQDSGVDLRRQSPSVGMVKQLTVRYLERRLIIGTNTGGALNVLGVWPPPDGQAQPNLVEIVRRANQP